MQAIPPILPLLDKKSGEVVERIQERHLNLIRFQAELEFIQCLANPMYLSELASQGYFDQSEFLNYLNYLDYWRKDGYVQYITYPTCLAYLILLRSPLFRERLRDPLFAKDLERLGLRHHETWRTGETLTEANRPKDGEEVNTKAEIGSS